MGEGTDVFVIGTGPSGMTAARTVKTKRPDLSVTVRSGHENRNLKRKGRNWKTFIATKLSVLLAEQGEAVTHIGCDVEERNGYLFPKSAISRTEHMAERGSLRMADALIRETRPVTGFRNPASKMALTAGGD